MQLSPFDFFAHTRLSPFDADDVRRFTEILSVYGSLGIKRLFLSYDVDLSVTPSFNVAMLRELSGAFGSIADSTDANVKIRLVPVVPLTDDTADYPDLYRFFLSVGRLQYVFVKILPTGDTNKFSSQLSLLTDVRRLIPIFVSFEKTALMLPNECLDTLLDLPRAAYQLDLPSVTSVFCRKLLLRLISEKKNVIFGTGDFFDACPYKNITYYIKFLRHAVDSSEKTDYISFIGDHNYFFS